MHIRPFFLLLSRTISLNAISQEPGPIDTHYAGQMGYFKCWNTCHNLLEKGSDDWNMVSLDDVAFNYPAIEAVVQSSGGCWAYVPENSPLRHSYGSGVWFFEAPVLDWDPASGEVGALSYPSANDFTCYCSRKAK